MGCKSCAGCSDTLVGNTQKGMVAWIQPCSAGPRNTSYSAMTDGDWPAVKVTGKSRQWRGARTPQWRRNSDGTNQICHVTEAVPGDNTITLEFADCGCGGYSPDEIFEQGSFDLYEMQRCCGLVDINKGWAKMKITRCMSFSGVDESPSTSYDTSEDGDLTRTYTGGLFVDAYTVYPITFGEVAAISGFDTGARVNDISYGNPAYGCTSTCEDACSDIWYAITNEGNVIYKTGKSNAIQNMVIPGFVTNNNNYISQVGNKLIVTTPGGYWQSDLDATLSPTTWTFTTVTATGFGANTPNLSKILQVSDNLLYVYGNLTNGSNAMIYSIDRNGSYEYVNSNTVTNGYYAGLAKCKDTLLAARFDGVVMHASGQCGVLSTTPTSPTVTILNWAAIQPGGTYWVMSRDELFYSDDKGETWNKVNLPGSTPNNLRHMIWVDAGTGYLLSNTQIYTTVNGGADWTIQSTGSRVELAPADIVAMINMAVPCCKSSTAKANALAIAGIQTGNVGAIWIGGVKTC